MAKTAVVTSSQAVAARVILLSLTAWRGAIERAHRHGVPALWLPHEGRHVPVADALRALQRLRDDARLKPFMDEGDRFRLRAKLGNWSPDDVTHAIWGLETVAVLVWAVQLLDAFPSWTASMTGFTSIGSAMLGQPTIDLVWRDASLRDRTTLGEHRRQAAAWRWRAWAEYFRRNMDDLAATLRPFAKATVKRVPEVARYCRDQGWFKPDLDDFPVAGVPYSLVAGDEVMALRRVAQSRNWAMQIALAGANSEIVATETDAERCLQILFESPDARA
jgi:hypothetical protein